MCFGSTKIKVPAPPAPSTEETRAKKLSLAQQELNIEQGGFDIVEDAEGNIELVKRDPTPEQAEQAQFDKDLRARIRESVLGDISPETRELVGETFTSAREQGEADIQRFARELAGERGLNLFDSPIAKEALLAEGRLATGLRSAEATSLLNVGERSKEFGLGLGKFREDLRQRAFVNRLNLAGQLGQFGLGLGQNRASLFRPQVISQPSPLGDIGKLLSGIGSLGGLRGK